MKLAVPLRSLDPEQKNVKKKKKWWRISVDVIGWHQKDPDTDTHIHLVTSHDSIRVWKTIASSRITDKQHNTVT